MLYGCNWKRKWEWSLLPRQSLLHFSSLFFHYHYFMMEMTLWSITLFSHLCAICRLYFIATHLCNIIWRMRLISSDHIRKVFLIRNGNEIRRQINSNHSFLRTRQSITEKEKNIIKFSYIFFSCLCTGN